MIRIRAGLKAMVLLFSVIGVFVGFLHSCDSFFLMNDDTFGQQGDRSLLIAQEEKGVKRTTIDFSPGALALSKNGDVYVLDKSKHQVFKIVPKDGTVELFAGASYKISPKLTIPVSSRPTAEMSYVDGPAATAKFLFPRDIAIDGDDVYVSDMENNAIRKIHQTSGTGRIVSTFAGSFYFKFGNILERHLGKPRYKNLFKQNRGFFLKVGKDQFIVNDDLLKNQTGYTDKLFWPRGIAVHKGFVYAANDGVSTTITKTDLKTRKTETIWTEKAFADYFRTESPQDKLTSFKDIAIDSKGTMYVLADNNAVNFFPFVPYRGRVFKMSSTGSIETFDVNDAYAIALDASDNLYITTIGTYIAKNDARKQIMVVKDGESTAKVFAGSTYGFLDGPRTKAQFGLPSDIVVDKEGNVYVADATNDAIRMINKSGQVMTIASKKAPGTVR